MWCGLQSLEIDHFVDPGNHFTAILEKIAMHCPLLHTLMFTTCTILDEDVLALLQGLSLLEKVWLRDCVNPTDHTIQTLAHHTTTALRSRLKELWIDQVVHMSAEVMSVLWTEKVTEVQIQGTIAVVGWDHLTCLTLQHIPFSVFLTLSQHESLQEIFPVLQSLTLSLATNHHSSI